MKKHFFLILWHKLLRLVIILLILRHKLLKFKQKRRVSQTEIIAIISKSHNNLCHIYDTIIHDPNNLLGI